MGFLHAPRCKDGTDNCSRRTDEVNRSADLPTAPFFRELRADKERSKENPDGNLFVTFNSELRLPKEPQASIKLIYNSLDILLGLIYMP